MASPRHLVIAETDRSPRIDFDLETGSFQIRGESYPEDAARFFGPLLAAVEGYFDEAPRRTAAFEIELSYFNSSSAKGLMNLFQYLEAAAERGAVISITWYYGEDDETMREFGEDFAVDITRCTFTLQPTATA